MSPEIAAFITQMKVYFEATAEDGSDGIGIYSFPPMDIAASGVSGVGPTWRELTRTMLESLGGHCRHCEKPLDVTESGSCSECSFMQSRIGMDEDSSTYIRGIKYDKNHPF